MKYYNLIVFLCVISFLSGCAPANHSVKNDEIYTKSLTPRVKNQWLSPDFVISMKRNEYMVSFVYPRKLSIQDKCVRLDIALGGVSAKNDVLWVAWIFDDRKRHLMRAKLHSKINGQFCFKDCGPLHQSKAILSILFPDISRLKGEGVFEIGIFTPQGVIVEKRTLYFIRSEMTSPQTVNKEVLDE